MVRQHLAFILLLSVFGTSCSEDGSPIASDVNTANTTTGSTSGTTTSTNSTNINGEHVGEIWVAGRFGSKRFNLQTGRETEISEGPVYPSIDGAEYVEFLYQHDNERDPECAFTTYNDIHQINVIETRTGTVKSSFTTDRDIGGPIRLSPDGERMATFVSEGLGCGTTILNKRLTVFSVNGDELHRAYQSIYLYDWHPDGRLIVLQKWDGRKYAIDIETAVGSYKFDSVVSFEAPPEISGFIGLRVSSTGDEVLIEGVLDAAHFLSGFSWRNSTVHRFSLVEATTGTDIFSYPQEERVNTPIYSPDGNFILVTEGYSSGAHAYYTSYPDLGIIASLDVVPVPASSTSYIVPVNAPVQPMPPEKFSDHIQPVLGIKGGAVSMIGFNPLYGLTWTPVVD